MSELVEVRLKVTGTNAPLETHEVLRLGAVAVKQEEMSPSHVNVSYSIFSLSTNPSLYSRGGTMPPLHLQTLEVTSPMSRHPRLHGDIRNSSVMPEHLGPPLYGQEMERHSEPEVKSTSPRHIGVRTLHLS